MLKEEKIENHSGVKLNLRKLVPPLREGFWKELPFRVGGDAPKNFIAVYNYEENTLIRKSKPNTWPKHIAKVGQKWYPIESINEFLFNRIGEILGLRMAASRLVMAGNQLRFLSQYFLQENESLEHGAQIFAGYLSDQQFVDHIEEQGLARKFFTFQFAETAIKHMFPLDSQLLLEDFVKMLVFDAIIGNNDRHFYNWGIIKDIESKKMPIFAPIYDSARGLFWNTSEAKLLQWSKNQNQIDEIIKNYTEGSKPKIGWEGLEDLNHFDLIQKIYTLSNYKNVCNTLITKQNLVNIQGFIKSEFSAFYSEARFELIERCLVYRMKRLLEFIKKEEVVC